MGRGHNKDRAQRLAEAEAIVRELPRTRDGKAIYPGLRVRVSDMDMSGEVDGRGRTGTVTSVASDHAWVAVDGDGFDQAAWFENDIEAAGLAQEMKEAGRG